MRAAAAVGWLGFALLSLVACAPPDAAEPETGAVVDAFLVARSTRDLDAALRLFADSAEVHSGDGVVWSGAIAVRAVLAERLDETYTVGERHISGNTAVWTEHVVRRLFGSRAISFDQDVEVTVEHGRIQRLVTFTGDHRPPPAALAPTDAPQPLSMLLAPLSVGLLMLGVLVWPAPVHHGHPAAADAGHLMRGLREYLERRG